MQRVVTVSHLNFGVRFFRAVVIYTVQPVILYYLIYTMRHTYTVIIVFHRNGVITTKNSFVTFLTYVATIILVNWNYGSAVCKNVSGAYLLILFDVMDDSKITTIQIMDTKPIEREITN